VALPPPLLLPPPVRPSQPNLPLLTDHHPSTDANLQTSATSYLSYLPNLHLATYTDLPCRCRLLTTDVVDLLIPRIQLDAAAVIGVLGCIAITHCIQMG